MAINTNKQSGLDATVYPFDYQRHPQAIESVDYVVSANGANVTCFIKLSAGVTITGVHEQFHDKNEDIFKNKAYNQAIERAESLGYKLA